MWIRHRFRRAILRVVMCCWLEAHRNIWKHYQMFMHYLEYLLYFFIYIYMKIYSIAERSYPMWIFELIQYCPHTLLLTINAVATTAAYEMCPYCQEDSISKHMHTVHIICLKIFYSDSYIIFSQALFLLDLTTDLPAVDSICDGLAVWVIELIWSVWYFLRLFLEQSKHKLVS